MDLAFDNNFKIQNKTCEILIRNRKHRFISIQSISRNYFEFNKAAPANEQGSLLYVMMNGNNFAEFGNRLLWFIFAAYFPRPILSTLTKKIHETA